MIVSPWAPNLPLPGGTGTGGGSAWPTMSGTGGPEFAALLGQRIFDQGSCPKGCQIPGPAADALLDKREPDRLQIGCDRPGRSVEAEIGHTSIRPGKADGTIEPGPISTEAAGEAVIAGFGQQHRPAPSSTAESGALQPRRRAPPNPSPERTRPIAITDPTLASMEIDDPRQSAQLSLAPLAIAFAEGELIGQAAEFPAPSTFTPNRPHAVSATAEVRRRADGAPARIAQAPGEAPIAPSPLHPSGSLDRQSAPAPSRSASPVAEGLADPSPAGFVRDGWETLAASRIAAERPVTGSERVPPVTAPRQSAISLAPLDADFGAASASVEPSHDASTHSAPGPSSRPADRRLEFVTQLVPVSVTLHSGGQGLSVTARIAGPDRETKADLERRAAEVLAQDGFGLAALTLNGQPVHTRRS